jgi:cytochrome c peroxidase
VRNLTEDHVRRRRILRCSLLSAASLLCLAVPQGPLSAQTYEEPPTAPPAAPAPPDSVDAGEVKVPPKSPPYLLSTYRSNLYAPLPAKIWKQGGIPKVINQSEMFNNKDGRLGNYNKPGPIITANNAFFQSLGQNGRSCVTCHNPPSGMGLALTNIKKRFRANLNDPLFAPVDGANCPDAVPVQYTSGSLYGGNKGKGKKALKEAYSLLLTKGLIRIPIKIRADAEYTVEVVSDRPGCNNNATFGKDPVTGEKILSMYRRPILSANLRFKSPESTDGNTVANPPTNVMWDGREPSLRTQAVSATLGHAQALNPPTAAQIDQIVDLETKFFSAQVIDKQARRLDTNGAEGGPVHLSGRSTEAPTAFPPPPAFDEYDNWANLTGNATADAQASIERGQVLFNTKPLTMANVGGFNDLFPPGPPFNPLTAFPATCSTCHGFPHAGSELVLPPQRDIGVGGHATAASFNGDLAVQGFGSSPPPANDLPIFKFTCINGAKHPFYGTQIITNDPGKGLITGKCSDLGQQTVPQLRALSARAPYFHDGSAPDIGAVLDFYDQRFNINFTVQEKTDLVNFLSAL